MLFTLLRVAEEQHKLEVRERERVFNYTKFLTEYKRKYKVLERQTKQTNKKKRFEKRKRNVKNAR